MRSQSAALYDCAAALNAIAADAEAIAELAARAGKVDRRHLGRAKVLPPSAASSVASTGTPGLLAFRLDKKNR